MSFPDDQASVFFQVKKLTKCLDPNAHGRINFHDFCHGVFAIKGKITYSKSTKSEITHCSILFPCMTLLGIILHFKPKSHLLLKSNSVCRVCLWKGVDFSVFEYFFFPCCLIFLFFCISLRLRGDTEDGSGPLQCCFHQGIRDWQWLHIPGTLVLYFIQAPEW